MEFSPSKKLAVPSSGPMDAEIVFISDSPNFSEVSKGEGYVGRGGSIFRAAAGAVGLDIASARLLHLVPIRAPGDNFEEHNQADLDWGAQKIRTELTKLSRARVIVPMGQTALHYVAGLKQSEKIGDWRGSAMQVGELRNKGKEKEDFLWLQNARPLAELRDNQWLLPMFTPHSVGVQYKWHPLMMMDLKRAKGILRNDESVINRPERKWFFNDLPALNLLAGRLAQPTSHLGVLAFDTESWPYYIVGLAIEDEVHVFAWDEGFREVVQEIFNSPFVIKVAHNLQHDLTFLKKKLNISVALPWFDTMGGAHVLNNALEKSLSPAISTRFTNWPYHKWLVDADPLWYNGLDTVVSYDAYAPQLKELIERGLYDVAKHDHQLLEPLLDMQWFGFKVDKKEQEKAAIELEKQRSEVNSEVQQLVEPIVDLKLSKFQKPKLFEVLRKCSHCGGGKVAAKHCWQCGGLSKKPKKKSDYKGLACEDGKCSVKHLREALPSCVVCNGTGKVTKRLEFNPDSSDQVADVLYRGLGIRPRKYKGKETIRVGLLEPLASQYPLVAKLVEYARLNADLETVTRLTAGPDGRLHCVFDPFGTNAGRVASKEGLVEVGTNAMNLPKKARRLVVPDSSEYVFLYPDMKAVEGRALAVLSKDPKLIEVFNDEKADLHSLVQADMQRIGFKDFTRDQAKRLDYAVPYGADAKQLGVELTDEAYRKGTGQKLSTAEAQVLIDTLLNGWYQGLRRWQSDVAAQLLQTRRVKSPTGRERVWLEYIYDAKTKGVKREIAKQGYSFAPQDIGAWVLGNGMLSAYHSGEWKKFRGLIHVHDALLFMAKQSDVEEAKEKLTKLLSQELWGMKFLTEMKTGNNWYEAS